MNTWRLFASNTRYRTRMAAARAAVARGETGIVHDLGIGRPCTYHPLEPDEIKACVKYQAELTTTRKL